MSCAQLDSHVEPNSQSCVDLDRPAIDGIGPFFEVASGERAYHVAYEATTAKMQLLPRDPMLSPGALKPSRMEMKST